jgi:hypothetical protein
MTNVKNISDAHESAVRGLSFAPSESKYVSCRSAHPPPPSLSDPL